MSDAIIIKQDGRYFGLTGLEGLGTGSFDESILLNRKGKKGPWNDTWQQFDLVRYSIVNHAPTNESEVDVNQPGGVQRFLDEHINHRWFPGGVSIEFKTNCTEDLFVKNVRFPMGGLLDFDCYVPEVNTIAKNLNISDVDCLSMWFDRPSTDTPSVPFIGGLAIGGIPWVFMGCSGVGRIGSHPSLPQASNRVWVGVGFMDVGGTWIFERGLTIHQSARYTHRWGSISSRNSTSQWDGVDNSGKFYIEDGAVVNCFIRHNPPGLVFDFNPPYTKGTFVPIKTAWNDKILSTDAQGNVVPMDKTAGGGDTWTYRPLI